MKDLWNNKKFWKTNHNLGIKASIQIKCYLRIHWRLSTKLKTNSKGLWSNAFWYVKVYLFRKFIQYTIHWDKTQMLQIFYSDTISITKNPHVFLLQAPIRHSFIFNSWFLYKLKHKFHLTLKHHDSFKHKNNRKATYSFALGLLIFNLQQEVWKFNEIYVSCSSPKTRLQTSFLNWKNWNFEYFTIFQEQLLSKYLTFLYLITCLFIWITYLFLWLNSKRIHEKRRCNRTQV